MDSISSSTSSSFLSFFFSSFFYINCFIYFFLLLLLLFFPLLLSRLSFVIFSFTTIHRCQSILVVQGIGVSISQTPSTQMNLKAHEYMEVLSNVYEATTSRHKHVHRVWCHAGGRCYSTKVEGGTRNLDKVRLITMLSWNSLCFTPFFFFFFRTADRIFPGRGLRNVLSKVIVTQALATIPINAAAISFKTATELSLNSFFEKTIEPLKAEAILSEIKERIDVDLATLFISSACFWSPVNFVNFRYFPTKYRVIPTIFGGIVWNTTCRLQFTKSCSQNAVVPIGK